MRERGKEYLESESQNKQTHKNLKTERHIEERIEYLPGHKPVIDETSRARAPDSVMFERALAVSTDEQTCDI